MTYEVYTDPTQPAAFSSECAKVLAQKGFINLTRRSRRRYKLTEVQAHTIVISGTAYR